MYVDSQNQSCPNNALKSQSSSFPRLEQEVL